MFHVENNQSSVILELRETARNTTNWYDPNLLAGNRKKYRTMNTGNSEDKKDASEEWSSQ